MAISNTDNIAKVTLTGSGQTIPVPFYFLEDGHLLVTKKTAGVQTELVLNSDYTVTGAGTGSGTVVMNAGAASDVITITYAVPSTQTVNYTEGGGSPAATRERVVDKLTMQVKELKEKMGRALLSNVTSDNTFPTSLTASRFLYVDSNGDPQEYSAAQVLALLNLEIPTSVVDRPITTFADSSARAASTPAFTGQIGIQLDTVVADPLGSIYTAGSTSVGDWDAITVSESDFSSTLATIFDKLERGQDKAVALVKGTTGQIDIGGAVPGMPRAAAWTSDNVTGAPGSGTDDHHGFPRAVYIPHKNRVLISYRVADAHATGDAAMWLGYTDDYGANWTHTELYDVANTDYRSLGLCLLHDDRILGVLARVDNATSGTKDYNLYAIYSSDFGITWTSPELLVANAANILLASTRPIQLRDSTILVPYYYATSASYPTSSTSRVLRSTDNGATWLSPVVVTSANNSTELDIAQRHDSDTLVAIIRNNAGTIHRSTSSDGGATWASTTDITAQVGSWLQGLPVLHLDLNNRLWMMSRITAAGSGLWYSDDYGATWSDPAAGNWGSVASYGDSVDLNRSDILSNNNKWAEGDIIPLTSSTLLTVQGGEDSGQLQGAIYLRTWVVGGGTAGGTADGLHLREKGKIGFDSITHPRLFDAERDALTASAGMAVFNRSAKCLDIYNGYFWEAQSRIDLPLNPALTMELDLPVEAETLGALATWTDDTATLGNWTTTNSPSITADEMRGKSALVFNGTNQDASDTTGGTQWDFLLDDSTNYTLIIPFKPHADNAGGLTTIFSTLDALDSTERGLGIWIDDRSANGDRCIRAGLSTGGGWAKQIAQRSVISPSSSSDPKVTAQRLIEWGNWHTLALTYLIDGGADPVTGEMRLYLDGMLMGEDTTASATRTALTLSRLPHLGSNDSDSNGTAYWFKGSMGRVLLYKDELTPAEVMQASTALIR